MKNKIFSLNAIVTFLLIVFLFGVTNVAFLYITKSVTEDCWRSLHGTAKNADSRLVFIDRSHRGALIGMSGLFTSPESFEDSGIISYIAESRIGSLQAPVRVYRPDGSYISERGVGTSQKIKELFKKYKSPAPIITTVHEDPFDTNRNVVEHMVPIRIKGEIVGVTSAVMDLNVLSGFIKMSNAAAPGFGLLVLDRRDGSLIMDSYHNQLGKLSEFSSRTPKRGFNFDKFVMEVNSKQVSDYAFISEKTGKVNFLTATPSMVDNWTMMVVIGEDIALARANLVKRVFLILSLVEIFAFIFYLLWMIRDIRKRLESENREYSDIATALSESYENLYYVNLADDSYVVFISSDKSRKLELRSSGTDFFEWAKKKMRSVSYEDDLDLITDFLTKSDFTDDLKAGESVSVEFRILVNGIPEYYRLKALKSVSEKNHVIFALENVNDEVYKSNKQRQDLERRNRMIASLASDFDCVNYIEICDANQQDISETYRSSELLNRIIPGWSEEKNFLYKLGLLLTYVVCDSDKDEFYKQTRREEILLKLKSSNSYFVNFKAMINGKELYYQLKFIADKDEAENVKGIVVGIHSVDEEIREQIEIQEKLKRNLEIIDILSEDYTALFYLNLKMMGMGVLSLSKLVQPDTGVIVAQTDSIFSAFSRFVSELVHPADRPFLEDAGNVKSIRNKLLHQKRFTIDFRRNYNGVYKYTRMTVAKAEGINDEPILLAIGFAEIDAQYRAEAERQENISRIMSLSDEFESIYDVNIDDGTYMVSTKGGRYNEDLIDNLDMDADYFESNKLNIPRTVYKDDQEMMLKCMTKEYMLDRLEKEMSYVLDYRSLLQEKVLWYRMRVTRSGNWMKNRRMLVGIFNNDENYHKEKAQQEALEQALQMAKSASRAKTTFLNNMSHDIRTPMNAIIGYTGLAKTHLDNTDQVKDYLGKIAQSSDHLLSLINDVLDMSRIESGKMNLNEKSENISNIIHMLKDIVQADIRSRKIDFFVDSADVCDEDVICDKLRLNQVLLNVLSNAIKYTPMNGVVSLRIVQVGVLESGYGQYEFRVKDTGIGMNEEFLKTIYDPFTRVQSSTVSGIQGTGLGMAITKNIVDMMGGKIDIQSQENVGTEVTLYFEFKLAGQHKEPERIPEVDGMRCLVVDDDTNACRSVVKMLKDIGMHSEWCASGREAVIRTEDSIQDKDLFGMFLIDWMMPDVNGVEVARRIRRMVGEDVPILILTAYDWSDIEEEAQNAGVTGFVSKPVFLSDLRKVVAKYCGKEEDPAEIVVPAVDYTGKKALLVEDNALNCEISKELLEDAGIKVTVAEDGSIAVKKMKAAKPGDYDIVLMDIQMPIMDGYEATRQIRALPDKDVANIPIIAMTANAFAEDCQAALEAGMNEHVSKPVDISKLRSILNKFLS